MMNDKPDLLPGKLKLLENELLVEIHAREKQFSYTAGRTEQHWCPIKHAIRLKMMHSRYQHFLDYGDAEQYRKRIEEVGRDFKDFEDKIILNSRQFSCYNTPTAENTRR